jgi:hypothetical protein
MSGVCDTKPAGTIYDGDDDEMLYGLPSRETIGEVSNYKFLEKPRTSRYVKDGLFPGRGCDWQTASASRPRYAPVPVFQPYDDSATMETRLVTARPFDGTLAENPAAS